MKAIGLMATLVVSGVGVSILGACTPAALTPEEIVPAFIAASQADTRTMRMEWQGTVAMSQESDPVVDPGMLNQTVSATFDFNGPDFAGTMTSVTPGGGGSSVSYARVSGVNFVNFSDSGWQRNDFPGGLRAAPELDPMHGLTTADVAYEALDTVDGRQVHRLRVLDPLAALSGGLFAQSAFPGSELTLNGPSDYLLYVDAKGIPVAARLSLALSLDANVRDVNSSNMTYEIHFDYAFSLWGEPVTISTPEVTGGGFDDVPPAPGIK
jgi:hypothetical protein